MRKRAAWWILSLLTLASLGLLVSRGDMHRQAYALSHADRLDARHGANLFQERGCLECHRLDGAGGLLGPDLSHVGARLPYETIDAVLTAPRSVNPHAMMPTPGLLPEEREELARFLAGLS